MAIIWEVSGGHGVAICKTDPKPAATSSGKIKNSDSYNHA